MLLAAHELSAAFFVRFKKNTIFAAQTSKFDPFVLKAANSRLFTLKSTKVCGMFAAAGGSKAVTPTDTERKEVKDKC